jgi:kinesin family protein 1
LEQQLEQQKSEYEEKLASAKMANVEIDQLRHEKEEMQEMLAKAKQEAERLLRAQAEEFEARVKGIAKATGYLSDHEKKIAKLVIRKWRKFKVSKLVDTLLQYAGLLKEAQVLSLSLDKKVVYQFAMITHDPFPTSQYEPVVDLRDETDDLLLYEKKPSLAVKVLDFNTNRVYFWSLSKFKDRLRIMRNLRDTSHTPLIGHDSSTTEDPFIDQQPPQFTLVGFTDVPLFAVSQQRSQRMKVDVYSPDTFSIVAELDVSVIGEPAITGVEQGFDVHLHSVQGFNAFMGTDFHVQVDLSKAGLQVNERSVFVSKKRNLSTGSTLKYDQRFTVDTQTPVQELGVGATRVLRFEIYVKPKLMLLESLSSWDELRSKDDANRLDETSTNCHVVNGTFIQPNSLTIDERHDVIARVEVQEMTASGKYEPVEYRKTPDDSGMFLLHLGVQRRLRLIFTHSSGTHLHFKRVADVKIGSVREINSLGKPISSSSGQKSSSMRVLSSKLSTHTKHESSPIEAITTFETSVSDADVMDRKTSLGNRIVLSLTAAIECERVLETIPFSMDVAFEVHSRNSGEPGWLAMFTPAKPISTACHGLFELVLTPAARRGRRNLWKRTSAQMYIRGEEILGGWKPRGLSLMEDHYACEKKLAERVDLEIAKCLAKGPFEQPEGSEEEYNTLLQHCVKLWKTPSRDPKPYVSHSQNEFLTTDLTSIRTVRSTNRNSRRRRRDGI